MKRYFFPIILVLSALLSVGYSRYERHNPYQLMNGDIVFQSGDGAQERAIKAATDSPWTHVGVVFENDGEWWVLEAVQPVKFTKLGEFIARSPKTFYAMRLKDTRPITPAALQKAHNWSQQQLNKPYDIQFLWDDQKLYCSELVWKVYKHSADIELCKPRPMGSYKLDHPNVKPLIIKRFGSLNKLPQDSPTVAPSDLAQSPMLVEAPKKK